MGAGWPRGRPPSGRGTEDLFANYKQHGLHPPAVILFLRPFPPVVFSDNMLSPALFELPDDTNGMGWGAKGEVRCSRIGGPS